MTIQTSTCIDHSLTILEGGGLEAPLSLKMTQWSCYCIVLEKVFVIGWRKEILWTTLIKSEILARFIIQKIQYVQ